MAANACTLLASQDAAALAGAPLPENFKAETAPTAQNGRDHTTVCGWFPKGYDLRSAEAPPEAGVQLTVHALGSAADAKSFHTNAAEMTREMAKSGPLAAKISTPAGIGENAILDIKTLGGNTQVATLKFVKGANALQIQAWTKGPGAGDVATKAAKQVAGKL
ncbi:MAG: hypothetical protein IPJ99_19510 [Betaproteobacteria bacterium]|nr:hypothetical protein [Betaproteobacteria bacterium]MBK8918063.1 hypothetical protein [Betaproteobacteria bacterium]